MLSLVSGKSFRNTCLMGSLMPAPTVISARQLVEDLPPKPTVTPVMPDETVDYRRAENLLNRLLPLLPEQEKCLHCTLSNGNTPLLARAAINVSMRGNMARMLEANSNTLAVQPSEMPALLGQARELLLNPATQGRFGASWWFRNVVSTRREQSPEELIRRGAQRIEWATHADATADADWPEPPLRPLAQAQGIVRQFLVMEGGTALAFLRKWAATVPLTTAPLAGPQPASAKLVSGVQLWVGSPLGRVFLPEFTGRADWGYQSPATPMLGMA